MVRKQKTAKTPSACDGCNAREYCPCVGQDVCPRKTDSDRFARIKQHGIEGYDVVALVNPKTLVVTTLSNVSGNLSEADLEGGREVYMQALEAALKDGVHHYEWSIEKNHKRLYYQTTFIPLGGPKGSIKRVLALVRDISDWGEVHGKLLKDWSSPRTFSQILLAARETEKKAISKALHDEIGSIAVILPALLGIVKASVKKGDQKQALLDIAKLDGQIKESVERVKNIVVSLRPPSLENDGALGGAVRDMLENISSFIHIPYTFDYKPLTGDGRVSDSVKIMLYRIVQEALNNIVKHANAKHIYVLLEREDGEVRLVVEDDGVGFKPSKQRSIRHVGLLAMKDSVELLGGTIAIKSAPGKGTRIEVRCPSVVYGGKE
ncbi:MAG: sensor histidine kinase [Elusimicrobia bacterium]|nr:sensor histidine kinase [Elusimicrobiota bacterium]